MSMTRDELIAALEAATGPHWTQSGDIVDVLGFEKPDDVPPWQWPPAYTASIDAALTLVLEGFRVALMEWDHDALRADGPWQCILSPAGEGDSIDSGQHARCDHAPPPPLPSVLQP